MKGSSRLPVHGFVLAGGKSSRMGTDKALLRFQGQAMVAIAVEKLRSFCAEIAIAGNRDDLAAYASVVHERRVNTGPAAGLEAGLLHARQAWALFLPVDVPLVPMALLRAWVASALHRSEAGMRMSYLLVKGEAQPAFCLLHQEALPPLVAALDAGERRVRRVLGQVAEALGPDSLWEAVADEICRDEGPQQRLDLERYFANLNTPEDLASAQAAAEDPKTSAE